MYNSDEMFEYFCTKKLVVFMALFMVVKTCSAPGPDKVDNSVGATTATEANSDENQDAGDTNWNEDCGLLKLVICMYLMFMTALTSKEEVLTTKFPVVPSHPATVG